VAHLKKFRDLRGRPSGPWSYSLSGEGRHVVVNEEDSLIGMEKGALDLSVIEPIASESAARLVDNVPIKKSRAFKFDLFRLGTFVAEISQHTGAQWRGLMRISDPDGVVVARTKGRKLNFIVDLATLNKSRDAAGKVRAWTLEVSPLGEVIDGSPRLSATVIGQGRITIAALKSRIDALLGDRGKSVEIFGENKDGNALVRLKINDVVSAETIDMHGLLDDALASVEQDRGVNLYNFEAHTVYTLASRSADMGYGLKLDVNAMRVGSIDVEIGPGGGLGASVPAVRLIVAVSGALKVKFGGQSLAKVTVGGGKLSIEVGIKLAPDGTPEIVKLMPNSPFDFAFTPGVKTVFVQTLGVWGLGGFVVEDYVEDKINQYFAAATRNLFSDPTIAPRILMTIFGAHLTYKSIHIDGDEIVFDQALDELRTADDAEISTVLRLEVRDPLGDVAAHKVRVGPRQRLFQGRGDDVLLQVVHDRRHRIVGGGVRPVRGEDVVRPATEQ
jgi:hypothetical protein